MRKLALEDDSLFVVSNNRTEIVTGIRDEMPATLIVDDAGGRLEVLSDLIQIREEIGAEFAVLACCWPGDQISVKQALNLPDSFVRSLELQTRDEIVDVIKAMGLFGSDELIREIVNQAVGRPGLAATLAYLALQGGAKQVAFGEALGDFIRSFSTVVEGKNTVEVLAAFSVGGNSGMSMQLVSDALDLPLAEVRQIVTDLAAAGVVSEVDSQFLCVLPATLRFVLVRDVFYSGAFSLPVEYLLSHAL